MSIQQSFNQGLSMAGMLLSLDPAKRAKKELDVEHERTKQRLESQAAAMAGARDATTNATEQLEYQKDLAAVKRKQFELDPSSEGYEAAYQAEKEAGLHPDIAEPASAEDIEQNIEEIQQERLAEYQLEERLNEPIKQYKAEQKAKASAEAKAKEEAERKAQEKLAMEQADRVQKQAIIDAFKSNIPQTYPKRGDR